MVYCKNKVGTKIIKEGEKYYIKNGENKVSVVKNYEPEDAFDSNIFSISDGLDKIKTPTWRDWKCNHKVIIADSNPYTGGKCFDCGFTFKNTDSEVI